jgi:hypothetical protein
MTTTDRPTRVTFEFDPQADGLEVWADDRTPTGLSRYGEQQLRNSVEALAYGNVFVDSVRIELVEEATSAEPLTAQSEPTPVGAPLRLDGVVLESCIVAVLRQKGITEPVRTTMGRDILRHLLADANAWLVSNGEGVIVPVAVAEELDLDAFAEKLADALASEGFTPTGRAEIITVVRGLLTDGATPTKRLQDQGLNREQLTDVIARHLEEDEKFGHDHSQRLADRLAAEIEAAQLDGTLS